MKTAKKYDPAIEVIRSHYEGEIRPYLTIDFGRTRKQGAISFIVEYSLGMSPRGMVAILKEELPEGFIAFVGNDRWLGNEKHQGEEVVVARTKSKFDALRLAESRGVNQDVSTEAVIEKLKEYDERYGIEIIRATVEAVEFRLDHLPSDLNAYLDDQSRTMVVDTSPRKKIIAQLQEHQIDGFWWD